MKTVWVEQEDGGGHWASNAELDAILRDENADHLADSRETVPAQRRTERRAATASQVTVAIKAHGNNYASAGVQLRNAAKRHFGSWAHACRAAGLQPPKETHG